MPVLNSVTQRKVRAILALPEPPVKPKPVSFKVAMAMKAISILERMDKKIDVAICLKK